jgi:uncharacterized protein (UPF0335 family)
MAKKKVEVLPTQPDELKELAILVEEFVSKLRGVDAEIDLLKGDRKEIIEEYGEKLDTKTLNAALKIVKIKTSSDRKHTLDTFLEILEKHEEGDVA